MKYEIRRLALGCKTAVQINRSEFDAIREAAASLFRMFQIEDDYDILLGNYAELEGSVLSVTLDSLLKMRLSHTEFDQDRRLFDRRFTNFLASAKAFEDHAKHNRPTQSDVDKCAIAKMFEEKQDSSLAYRSIYAIRNHAQHCGLPLGGVSYQRKREDAEERPHKTLICTVSPYLAIYRLRQDSRLSRALLDEMEKCFGKEIAILPLVREYVSCVSSVISQIRSLYAERLTTWRKLLQHWVGEYLRMSKETSNVGIVAVQDDGAKIVEQVYLTIEIEKRLDVLQDANRKLNAIGNLQLRS